MKHRYNVELVAKGDPTQRAKLFGVWAENVAAAQDVALHAMGFPGAWHVVSIEAL